MNPENPINPSSPDRAGELIRLLGAHEAQLRGYVLAMVPHWADADDIVQQTRIRIFEQFDEYDRSRDFGAWARTIAYYEVLTHREKSSRSPQLCTPEFFNAITEEVATAAGRSSHHSRALTLCLEKLDEVRRNLLMRYYSGRETIKEIAGELSLSVDVVKARLHRSRMTLSRCVERTIKGYQEEQRR